MSMWSWVMEAGYASSRLCLVVLSGCSCFIEESESETEEER